METTPVFFNLNLLLTTVTQTFPKEFFKIIANTVTYSWFLHLPVTRNRKSPQQKREALKTGVPEGRTVNNLRFQPEALRNMKQKPRRGLLMQKLKVVNPCRVLVFRACHFLRLKPEVI